MLFQRRIGVSGDDPEMILSRCRTTPRCRGLSRPVTNLQNQFDVWELANAAIEQQLKEMENDPHGRVVRTHQAHQDLLHIKLDADIATYRKLQEREQMVSSQRLGQVRWFKRKTLKLVQSISAVPPVWDIINLIAALKPCCKCHSSCRDL